MVNVTVPSVTGPPLVTNTLANRDAVWLLALMVTFRFSAVVVVPFEFAVNVNPTLALCPSGLVTTTFTGPAVIVGVTAVILVAETTTTEVPGLPPNVTVAPDLKFVPVIVTDVPPAAGPELGLMEVIVGGGATTAAVNPPVEVAVWPSGLITTIFTGPAVIVGVTTVMLVAETTTTEVPGLPPKVTVAPDLKFIPVMVTDVPPAAGPDVGLMEVIVGGALAVKPPLSVAVCPSGLITTTFTGPAVITGVTTEMMDAESTLTEVPGALPKVTVSPLWKFVPVIVTVVPPVVDPELGVSDTMVGAGAGFTVKLSACIAFSCGVPESSTCTVKLSVIALRAGSALEMAGFAAAAAAFPEMTPVLLSNVNPCGREPEAMLHV